MDKDPIVIIGGTPRVIGQVRHAKKKGIIKDDMNLGEILNTSRATRLLNKELEKVEMNTLYALGTGKLMNKVVTLPNVDWKSGEFNKINGSFEKAKSIELSYANQAAALSATKYF